MENNAGRFIGIPYTYHGWIWISAIFIFFFNSFLLPQGLTYTLLFTPVWIYFLYTGGRIINTILLCLPFLLYSFIHIHNGVSLGYYIISDAILVGNVFFLSYCYRLLNSSAVNWDLIFRDIALLNFLLVLLALLMLFIPPLKLIVWYTVPISRNIPIIPRLQLFTYEPSFYSFILAPVVIYFYSRVLFFKTSNSLLILFIVTLPLLLSFSFGVIGSLLISGVFFLFVYFKKIFFSKQRRLVFFSILAASGAALVVLYYFYPNNLLFNRFHNVINGEDTSGRGRTYEAFILAHKIIAQKSFWWGIGPGQLKVLGREIIIQFYYYQNIPEAVRIPNACAETIVYFGYIGFAIRMALEVYLFFKTKVFSNPFRFWLFVFVFIYQFTGSFITNVMEYVIWLMAFSNIFPELNNIKNSNTQKAITD